ncbi:MAG: 3-oxoacyl-[acyl-carrier-protein] reductase [Aestuariivita sp.]|nr:3-oxoacyl-[acyl-carrier-protein] reductase [Aestuariivita sp.]MCY4203153.1 3-oxoacyl-[acyl-carrier-protein] reductase [Aestuariivita sp.]MCY4289309.1 3-oxoacyl-[acyl-carrier-protein] reductase [Aestuariivita sp.]MCY4347807.1 3-oxoacyl-[acyl-carrier-protein] reductase [Aestuariivita sp.]
MFNLEGKNALITGASGGIGSAIAKSLRAAGATVALTGTREEVLEKLTNDLGSDAYPFPCDLRNPEAITKLTDEVGEKLGSIDILINNAGATSDTILLRMSDDDWNQVLELNLTATFRLSKSVLRSMIRARWGRIINISSVVAQTGNVGQGNYVAAKAGIIGFTKSLAQEVASRGITANAVAPGFIDSAMTKKLNAVQKTAISDRIPMKRMGTPDEVAASVVFLASNEASYLTGVTLHVNGGMAMV